MSQMGIADKFVAAEPGRDWASAVAVALVAIHATVFVLLLAIAWNIDSARPAPAPPAESVALGPQSDFLLDFGTIAHPADVLRADVASRFQPADGKLPVAGLQYFSDGALWVRFVPPVIRSDDRERTIRLSDPRVRHAWLVWRDGDTVQTRNWDFDGEERRAGLGSRTPAFSFPAGAIEGREVVLGFTSLSVLRGAVFFETRRAYEAWEFNRAIVPSLLGGALLAIGAYLCVTGGFTRDAAQVWAGVMSFALFTVIFGGAGLFHVSALPADPSLADFVAYMPKPLVLSAWLMFLVSHLRLAERTRWLYRMLVGIALLVPFQASIGALKVGFDWNPPVPVTSSIPAIIGFAAGLVTLLVFAARGSRSARLSLVCWLPLMVGTIGRSLMIVFPDLAPVAWLQYDPLADVVVSMLALSAVLVLDRQARERTLRERAEAGEQRLREFAQIASHSFFETGRDGVVSGAAGPAAGALAIAPGFRLADLVQRLEGPDSGFGDRIAATLSGGSGFREAEYYEREPGGRQVWYSFNIEPWQDAAGVRGLRGTIEEVTARVERRSQIAQQGRLAAMGQLAGGIAHEVNNLLHPVVNLARRVRDRHVEDREGRRLLDLVIDSGKRAGEVVEGVLESVSTTRRRSPVLPLSIAVERALAAAVAMLPPHVRLVNRIEPLASPAVPLGQTLQVIGNLVQNAGQAIDGAGEVVVALGQGGQGHAELSVSDNGRGMDEELRRTALQPFVTTRSDGTGLGLSAVASIVAEWNGAIDIRSKRGEGTTVIIRIPQVGA
jgi:signal transduction histidine kinase